MTRDGGSTTIKFLNLLKKHQGNLSSLVATLPKFHLHKLKVDCPQDLNQVIMKKAQDKFKGTRVETIDGLKIWLKDNSWLLFRPSSNEAAFRVFAEAKTKEEAKNLAEKGMALVKAIAKKGK